MRIGYACLTIGVPDTVLSGCILKNATDDNLRKLTIQNLIALEHMIDYNMENDIKLFRISSDIIPFGSHHENHIIWWEDYGEIFERIGKKIKKAEIRVTMHPGQYTVLNATNPTIVQNARKELLYHDRFLTALGMDRESKLILHIGGVYGDKQKASEAFIRNYDELPDSIKDRLILENDDKNYNISDVLSISHATGAPVVFDNLHHKINPPEEKRRESEWVEESGRTWREKDGRQKLHYSQQKEGGSPGSHSDTIILKEFLDYYNRLPNTVLDIMLEVKDKNLSAVKCINTVRNSSGRELEKEWERYQYYILSRSTRLYQELIDLMKEKYDRTDNSDRNDKPVTTDRKDNTDKNDKTNTVALEFYDIVEQALLLPEDKEAEVTAARQIWEFIEEDSTSSESNRYYKLLNAYLNHTGTIQPLKKHLMKCAWSRGIKEMMNSLYFYIV